MATDSFIEAMHRLKEIHEKEVLGIQTKLTELTMEKCRDAQRIEELFSKNHILREQLKILNENIKVLENRLRAGLCDRCTVTQEIAKKKQLDYENSHFHSMQQLSSLTTEMNGLKEENRSLLEELKKLKSFDEKSKQSRARTPETKVAPVSPLSLTASGGQKNVPEQPSKDSETQEMSPENQMSEEKSIAVSRFSPGEMCSQAADKDSCVERVVSGTQNLHPSKQNQQRISNQLHNTIAVLRPGYRTGQMSTGTSLHSKGSCADSYEASLQLETLKKVMPEEQFCILSQHLSQKQSGQRGPSVSGDAMGRYLLAKSREAELVRKRSQNDWEEKAAMAELHSAVLYMREQEYRSRLKHPDQKERLHYILARQHQGQRSPKSPDVPKSQGREGQEEGRLTLLDVLSKRLKSSKYQDRQLEEHDEGGIKSCPEPEREKEEEPTRDKPLDLSDSRRGPNSHQSDSRRDQFFETYRTSPTYSNKSSPSKEPSTELVHVSRPTESSLPRKGIKIYEYERSEQTCYKEGLELCLENDSESTSGKRSTRGQTRECETEQDEEEDAREVQSLQEMLNEVNTSCSETETENIWHVQSASPGEDLIQNKTKVVNKWGKKRLQGSKKSLKRKRRTRDLRAGSDTSQEGDETKSTSSNKALIRETQE
ncbi:RBBP8 N-terminal-like protein [Discoglossus pictus]